MRAVVLFVTCVLGTSLVRADAEVSQLSEADRLFLDGRKQLADGKAEEACGLFERALVLAPDAPATLLNLGLCNELLGRLKTSIDWLGKAQLRAIELEQREVETTARKNLVRLKARVPTVTIALARPELRPRVTIDGVPIAASDFGRVELDAGEHVLEASADGYRTVHERFDIQDEAKRTLTLAFEPAAVDAPVVARPRSRAHVWVGLGGAVLLAGGATVVLYEKYGVYEPARDRFRDTLDEADRTKANRARTIVDFVGTPMLAGGVVALGVAGYLWLRRGGEGRSVALVPAVAPDGVGFGLAGSWR